MTEQEIKLKNGPWFEKIKSKIVSGFNGKVSNAKLFSRNFNSSLSSSAVKKVLKKIRDA